MIFDAGVFMALENPSQRRIVVALMEKLLEADTSPSTTETVLAQVWRDPMRQVPLARLVAATTVYPFGEPRSSVAAVPKPEPAMSSTRAWPSSPINSTT